jgi:hypothetical protein
MNCPISLGSGKVHPIIRAGRNKLDTHIDLSTDLTCPACHGSGIRPEWMNDERHKGTRDPNFDYVASQ